VAVVVEVVELIAPLCYYPQGILEERHDDEETANGGQIAASEENGQLRGSQIQGFGG